MDKERIMLVIIAWNVIVFFVFGVDKLKAIEGRWRIPEKALFICSFALGGIGGLAGMKLFRHKTKHLSFQILIPVSFVLTLAAIICLYRFF